MNSFRAHFQKKKVIFVMGATGTGKSRLSIDIATQFPAEIINSDKIQVYKGLDIVTNKVSEAERKGVTHHLLGEVEPDSDFTAGDFCYQALLAMEWIVRSGRVPIIVGGSNSFIEALVEDHFLFKFRANYDCCFIWLDVSSPVLHSSVSERVDQMVDAGLVDEVRGIFATEADYARGIRRAIGVPEMDKYLRADIKILDEKNKDMLLGAAIEEIKANTCHLASRQREKIKRLRNELRWAIHRIDATRVFEKCGQDVDKAWEELVVKECLEIVGDFLHDDDKIVAAASATITSAASMKRSFEELQVTD
ncbi:unnamed protein product [Ilex paraguariensis]|uniref:adenylate dimethylallyltransferase (ADP/ATP-dependent) n=1 Tax=Ilex paraguariensis TaxID=185542 RepID=A0ABC8RCG6_9AQUA